MRRERRAKTVESKNTLNELMNAALAGLKCVADANTIIGAPIRTDDVTLIPVSRLSFGVACGGGDFSTKGNTANFGGGGGSSAKVEPVAFLVVKGDSVRLLPVAPPPATTVDRIIETVPEVMDKVTDFVQEQQEKKAKAKEATADFAE